MGVDREINYAKMRSVKKAKIGRIIIPASTNPWPHEERVARILALAGYVVEFIPEAGIKTPDIYLNGKIFEIKSPVSNNIGAVERNLVKALAKSQNIVFDSSRMKIRDEKIISELIKRRREGKRLKKILLIDKQGKIIDIERFV